MKIQILKGHDKPEIKKFTTKAGKEMELFEQRAYMHNGGVFPVEFKISHDSLASALPVGDYQICPTSFTKNNFDSLALDPYQTKFIPFLDSKPL